MMNAKIVKKYIEKMKRTQVKIAKERDVIDDVIGEMEGLKEDCSEAWDALQDARDALSRLQ